MEDNFNTGGTVYRDKNGKEISEQEYMTLTQNPQSADAQESVSADTKLGGKKDVSKTSTNSR